MRNKKGFTLIELMIVIAIIAILAAILVPNFLKARAQGQLAACESNMKNIATSLEMYATDYNGRYPTSSGLLTSENYMRNIPNCPVLGSSVYTYTASSGTNVNTYTMYCPSAKTHTNTTQVATTGNYPQYTPSKGLYMGK